MHRWCSELASRVRSFEGLLEAVADETFDRSPAVVCNAHITGLAVARALDVPTIALDRTHEGVASYSNTVDLAGHVTYPLDDRDGFADDLTALAEAAGESLVVFPCMDEWANALAATEPSGVRLPFDPEAVGRVLDKSWLYDRATDLGVPVPTTHDLSKIDPDVALGEFGFPLVLKPALKRPFEEAFGTNLIVVDDRETYHSVISAAAAEGVPMLAQELVGGPEERLETVASYRGEAGGATTFVGHRAVTYPAERGTSCLVRGIEHPELVERTLTVLADADYHGISEAEFIHDPDRDEFLLIDINTRPWKWIGLPIAAGANLPAAAYGDAVGTPEHLDPSGSPTWVSIAGYAKRLADGSPDRLTSSQWRSVLSGRFETEADLTTAVYRPSDPGPFERLLRTEFEEDDYYCSC